MSQKSDTNSTQPAMSSSKAPNQTDADPDRATLNTLDSGIESEADANTPAPLLHTGTEQDQVDDEEDEADNVEAEIEVDFNSDSGYDEQSLNSLLSSLGTAEHEDVHQHGHRYHGSGNTLLPNDESEQDRLDLQHHILKLCLDGDLTATSFPVAPHRVLDVGTGTGIWAIEFADKYPASQVTGVDLSPIQPGWVPPNVLFEIDDVTLPWARTPESIDFVHIRNMVGSIRDWKELFTQALEHIRPGGTIEVTDIRTRFECRDHTFADRGKSCKTWADAFHEIANRLGMNFDPTPDVPGWLEEVGFEKVQMESRIIPVGPWPKDRSLKRLGAFYLSHMLEGGMENYSMKLFTDAGWDATSVHALLGTVRNELKDPKMHTYTTACFITGRKKLV